MANRGSQTALFGTARRDDQIDEASFDLGFKQRQRGRQATNDDEKKISLLLPSNLCHHTLLQSFPFEKRGTFLVQRWCCRSCFVREKKKKSQVQKGV